MPVESASPVATEVGGLASDLECCLASIARGEEPGVIDARRAKSLLAFPWCRPLPRDGPLGDLLGQWEVVPEDPPPGEALLVGVSGDHSVALWRFGMKESFGGPRDARIASLAGSAEVTFRRAWAEGVPPSDQPRGEPPPLALESWGAEYIGRAVVPPRVLDDTSYGLGMALAAASHHGGWALPSTVVAVAALAEVAGRGWSTPLAPVGQGELRERLESKLEALGRDALGVELVLVHPLDADVARGAVAGWSRAAVVEPVGSVGEAIAVCEVAKEYPHLAAAGDGAEGPTRNDLVEVRRLLAELRHESRTVDKKGRTRHWHDRMGRDLCQTFARRAIVGAGEDAPGRGPHYLVSLVGGSWPTVALAASRLGPKKLVLVASAESAGPRWQGGPSLKEFVRGVLPEPAPGGGVAGLAVDLTPPVDPDVPASTRDAVIAAARDLGRDLGESIRGEQIWIDVSGGKTQMKLGAAAAAAELGANVFYVDCWRFDPNVHEPVPGTEYPRLVLAASDDLARVLEEMDSLLAQDRIADALRRARAWAARPAPHGQAMPIRSLVEAYAAWAGYRFELASQWLDRALRDWRTAASAWRDALEIRRRIAEGFARCRGVCESLEMAVDAAVDRMSRARRATAPDPARAAAHALAGLDAYVRACVDHLAGLRLDRPDWPRVGVILGEIDPDVLRRVDSALFGEDFVGPMPTSGPMDRRWVLRLGAALYPDRVDPDDLRCAACLASVVAGDHDASAIRPYVPSEEYVGRLVEDAIDILGKAPELAGRVREKLGDHAFLLPRVDWLSGGAPPPRLG